MIPFTYANLFQHVLKTDNSFAFNVIFFSLYALYTCRYIEFNVMLTVGMTPILMLVFLIKICIVLYCIVLYCIGVTVMIVECHFQQYFRYIVALSFIGGGIRGTRRKPQTYILFFLYCKSFDKLYHI